MKKTKNTKVKNGSFIVIDGTDGSGKATQTELLLKRLKKEKVKVKKIDFPRYSQNHFGRLLDECLKKGSHGDFISISPKIASTLYAADRFESSKKIREWLDKGYTVVSDRYVSANQIHQGGKITDEKERKEFLKWLDIVEYRVFGIPKPDVIVYLHVPIEVSLKLIMERAQKSGVAADQAEANAHHLYKSQQSALKIIEKNNKWIKVNCTVDNQMCAREDIHEEIVKKLGKYIKK